ncbi:helix-hairpin-helix domain-containing protein [Natrarchaeobius halalkaliphilus]|uniref:helix-hairpin-helix domain-containing protein n=1 Tax=Natrarchaeobius halalkaliphilus TaxID=1679091 RepID=UPI000F52A928
MSNEHVAGESAAIDVEIDSDERDALEAANVDAVDVTARDCSYRVLLDAGVDEEIADALRRRFSLPWSFETDGDLDRRSTEVKGLGDGERAWIAASEDDGWQAFERAHSRATRGESDDVARPWPRPTPVEAVAGIGPEDADALAEAGIVSAERLATIDATQIADVLEFDVLHVRTWRYNARELIE